MGADQRSTGQSAAGYSCRTVVPALVVSRGAAQAHPGAASRIGTNPEPFPPPRFARFANHQMISPYQMITPGWRQPPDPGTSAAPERPAWAGRPAGRGIAAPGQPDRNPATGCPEGGQTPKPPRLMPRGLLRFRRQPLNRFQPSEIEGLRTVPADPFKTRLDAISDIMTSTDRHFGQEPHPQELRLAVTFGNHQLPAKR